MNERMKQASKWFRAVLETEEKGISAGAHLACALHALAQGGDLDSTTVITFAEGASRTRANEILHNTCLSLSTDYATMYSDLDDNSIDESERAVLDRKCKALRKAATRSLLVTAWAIAQSADTMRVDGGGNIVIHKESGDITTSLRRAEQEAKSHFRPESAKGAYDKTGQKHDLASIAAAISDITCGKEASDFSAKTRAALQDALVALLGVFGAEDARKIERLYREAGR